MSIPRNIQSPATAKHNFLNPNFFTPVQFQLGAGYSQLQLSKEAAPYRGAHYEVRMGKRFQPAQDKRHILTASGAFRQAFLFSSQKQSRPLSQLHFGLEAEYQFRLKPYLSPFLNVGLGADIFYAPQFITGSYQGFDGQSSLDFQINNGTALGLTVGGGFYLFKFLSLAAAYQHSFGLKYKLGDVYEAKVNPYGVSASANLDLAPLIEHRGEKFPRSGFQEFYKGLLLGTILESTWTPSLNRPASGENTYLVFSKRADRPMLNLFQLSAKRETDEKNPLGFGIVLDVGENVAVSKANTSLSGKYFDFQQLWGEIRLPFGRGFTIRGGKLATLIGLETLEPINNQIHRSLAFGYGIPFTHAGAWGTYPFTDKISLTLGITHGWDNFLNRDAGIAGISALKLGFSEYFKLNLSGSIGKEAGPWRSVVDVITTSSMGNFDLAFNLDWGRQGPSHENAGGNWVVASLNPKYNFREIKKHPDLLSISGRAEFFYDENGLRTGYAQTIGAETLTLGIKPLPEPFYQYFPLHLRGEIRHDHSTENSFFLGANPFDRQITFAVGATLVYSDLIGLFSKKEKAQ